MSTPNKRRKTNNHQSPAVPGKKSLDFFFGRQREKKHEVQEESEQDGRVVGDQLGNEVKKDDVEEGATTDEQLARKLQAEWDAEERQQQQQGNQANLLKDEYVASSTAADTATHTEPTAKEPVTCNAFAAMGKKNTLSLQSATAAEDTISHDIPFDGPPLTFEPQQYLPELRKQWASEGGHCTYALLTHCFVLVGSTTSRIKTVDTLVNMLRTLIEGDPESLLPAVWLATNSISPPYIDIELGLGGSAISKALKKVCGLDNAALRTLYNKHGDAGDVAYEAKKKQSFTLRKPKPLTIKGVYESLHKIAAAKGTGCQVVKQGLVERLVQDARGAEESRYVVRTLAQHLRIGAVKTTMLIALSRAFLLSKPPTADFATKSRDELRKLSKQDLAAVYQGPEELVKACFARRPNYNDLVPTMLEIGVHEELLIRCGLAMHIPLRPMLGGITRDLGEMLTKLQGRDFACEFKYDGQRAQVHCDSDGKVSIFSRHLEVMTDKYPDLVSLVPRIRGEGVSSFILEGEVVAVDRATGDLKPFQVLANRARKDVVIQAVTVDVCLFAFDLMYLNGEELLDRPFRERRSLLRSLFVEIPNHFTWVRSLDATSGEVETVSDFFKQATDIKCEGIMVKVLDHAANPDLLAEMDVGGEEDVPTPSKPQPPKPTTKRPKKALDPLQNSAAKYAASLASPSSNPSEGTAKPSRRKPLLATYEPDKRLDAWLKVKKDYHSQTDTIDLIPVGAWHGSGRKHAWWSPILLACRDPATGSLQVVTKCMSGFTDAFYRANRARYDPDFSSSSPSSPSPSDADADGIITGKNILHTKPSYIEYSGHPAVWFEPQEVWEMVFADITLSPTYTAAIGLVSEDRGLSMRFPRFLRVREDKGIEEASTSEFLAELYRKQEMRGPVHKGGRGGDEEEGDELYE